MNEESKRQSELNGMANEVLGFLSKELKKEKLNKFRCYMGCGQRFPTMEDVESHVQEVHAYD